MPTKLVSMKLSKRDAEQGGALTSPEGDRPAYPYGLSVRLDTESLKKLGIDASDYAAGDTVLLVAECEVTETGSRESLIGGESQNIELQITDLCLEDPPAKKSGKSPAAALYGGE
jgi:hypothetical protein